MAILPALINADLKMASLPVGLGKNTAHIVLNKG